MFAFKIFVTRLMEVYTFGFKDKEEKSDFLFLKLRVHIFIEICVFIDNTFRH